MGAPESKPNHEPPPPNPEFDTPWRKMQWEKNDTEQKLRDFKRNQPHVRFVRILVVGDVGAGKSSFINSINNAFQKRITSEALTNSLAGKSFTKNYKTYYIEEKDGSSLPFIFNDVMGLEADETGAHSQDVIRALKGLLQEGYNFDVESSGSVKDQGYRSNPSLQDQIHCLVIVIAADTVSIMKQEVIDKMKIIRQAAVQLNMPQVIIMTRPDLACPLVRDDIRKVYTSKKIKEKMQECSNRLGITMNHIFPVKNYHEEMDTDDNVDALIFKALDQIVNIACDTLRKTTLTSGDKHE